MGRWGCTGGSSTLWTSSLCISNTLNLTLKRWFVLKGGREGGGGGRGRGKVSRVEKFSLFFWYVCNRKAQHEYFASVLHDQPYVISLGRACFKIIHMIDDWVDRGVCSNVGRSKRGA